MTKAGTGSRSPVLEEAARELEAAAHVLRVTEDEHGGDAHGEHVEAGISGARPAVGARGVGVVLTVAGCAARVTPWWSW